MGYLQTGTTLPREQAIFLAVGAMRRQQFPPRVESRQNARKLAAFSSNQTPPPPKRDSLLASIKLKTEY